MFLQGKIDMEEIDLSRITELENHIDDLALEEMINALEEQAREYSNGESTTYHQIVKWLRELQKYRKLYPQDRTSSEVN